jgi:predicted DNA-binding transcriptional regulator AlpA
MSKEFEGELREIRSRTKEQLREICKAPGSMLSPEVVSHFLGASYRTIYRWFESDIYFPSIEQCQMIVSFLQKVKDLRGAWRALAGKWKGFGFEDLEEDVRLTLFNPKLLSVLEDGELSLNEKVEEAVMQSLRTLAKI